MILAVVQARMGSTRLPGKVLMDLAGKPMLLQQLERLDHCNSLDALVVAIPDLPGDDVLAHLLTARGRGVFRGSESDVLDRCWQCAREREADVVVRLTADCPLICPEVTDKVVALYREGGYDYVSNVEPRTYPVGLDTEVFPFRILELMWREAKGNEREHVTPYVRLDPRRFRHGVVRHDPDLSWMRWTVDEPRDLEFVRQIYARLYREGEVFGMEAILELLEREPELMSINQGVEHTTDAMLERLRAARKQRGLS